MVPLPCAHKSALLRPMEAGSGSVVDVVHVHAGPSDTDRPQRAPGDTAHESDADDSDSHRADCLAAQGYVLVAGRQLLESSVPRVDEPAATR